MLGVDRDADRALALEREAADDDRLLERLEQPLGDERAGVAVAHLGDQDAELVAAEAGDHLAVAEHALEALGHALEKEVAVVVAERVVDLLEAVEVHQHHGDELLLALGAEDRLLHEVVEHRAVREAGERVGQRLLLAVGGLLAQAARGGADDEEEQHPERREADGQDGDRVARVLC